MPKKRPTKAPLPKEKIADAIGDKLKISENLKRQFAAELVKELDNVFSADGSAYPDTKVVDGLIADLDALHALSSRLEEKAKKFPFVGSLLRLTSRRITQKKYNAVDAADIWAFSERAGKWARTARFRKKNGGPDTRLAIQVALIVAQHYRRVFQVMPAIGGGGKRESRTGAVKIEITPYQRVCDVISKTKGIKIGRPTQALAIRLMKEGKQPAPYFKPDVTSLPEKKLD